MNDSTTTYSSQQQSSIRYSTSIKEELAETNSIDRRNSVKPQNENRSNALSNS
jgi:hypothetical protein